MLITTSSDPVGAYQEAFRAYSDATQHVEAMNRIVATANELLQNDWKRLVVLHGKTDVEFPAEVILGGSSIDAREWPDAEHLADVLSTWHQARGRLEQVWNAIPMDRRVGLIAPP